jgi:hypothetical protein
MDWERKALQKGIDDGSLTLVRTQAWIQATVHTLFKQGTLKLREKKVQM